MFLSLHCKSSFFLKDFYQNWNVSWKFNKSRKYKVWSKSFQRDAELLHADRRSDMTRLMVIFCKLLSKRTVNRFDVWWRFLE